MGTNTIRQNYSRVGGLGYIVGNGGTITEAVSTQVWSGEAVVHVSIANWIKGEQPGRKKLYTQIGDRRDGPWEVVELDAIGAALSASYDVTLAARLRVNIDSEACYQGQTHGHEGFLVAPAEADGLSAPGEGRAVLFPYLTGDDLLSEKPPAPQRFVVDFHPLDVLAAARHEAAFRRIRESVLPDRQSAATEESARNAGMLALKLKARVNVHHQNFLKRWWLLSYPRPELIGRIESLPRYIACARVTKRPIFEFVDPSIRPSDALQVFALADDYSFGLLQSTIHWKWFVAQCSTLKSDFRYTSDSVFDTFPWPQAPTRPQVRRVAEAGVALRALRARVMVEHDWSLRELYRTLDLPGEHPLRTCQQDLDRAVRAAYGMRANADPLAFLLDLNLQLAEREASLQFVVGPGLPPIVADPTSFISDDRVRMP